MNGINKVILLGTLGQDPQVSYLPSGVCVAKISVATTRSTKDKESGQYVKSTDWTRVVFFARQAEICAEYCQKGSKIYVCGRLQTRKYVDEAQKERYITEVVGDELQIVSGFKERESKDAAMQQANAFLYSGDDALDKAFAQAASGPLPGELDDIPF